MIELLTTNHLETILNLFEETQNEVKIISPFLTLSMVETLCDSVKIKGVSCAFITRLYLEDVVKKANSIDALERMLEAGIKVYLVRKLHTKLYLFDGKSAILGSANFTNGGFRSNVELSLLLSGQDQVTRELQDYFDDMARELDAAPEGVLTPDIISDARKLYEKHYHSRKHMTSGVTYSGKMYGALLGKNKKDLSPDEIEKELKACEGERDLVRDLFKQQEQSEQVLYGHTIWLKFVGEGNDRFLPDERYTPVSFPLDGGTAYLANYPYKVAVRDGDEIYFAALSTDSHGRQQPIIVGRGHLVEFSPDNFASEPMVRKYDWMCRFPWYCIVKDCEFLDTVIKNGVPMDEIWDALGSDTYAISFGKQEDISAVTRKHHRKAHIKLSGNAKELIDKKFDGRAAQFGLMKYPAQ